jgi:hypothetical protein
MSNQNQYQGTEKLEVKLAFDLLCKVRYFIDDWHEIDLKSICRLFGVSYNYYWKAHYEVFGIDVRYNSGWATITEYKAFCAKGWDKYLDSYISVCQRVLFAEEVELAREFRCQNQAQKITLNVLKKALKSKVIWDNKAQDWVVFKTSQSIETNINNFCGQALAKNMGSLSAYPNAGAIFQTTRENLNGTFVLSNDGQSWVPIPNAKLAQSADIRRHKSAGARASAHP